MSREVLQMALTWFEDVDGDTDEGVQAPELILAIKAALAQPEHPEQMARFGWQYFECPACGSEGARAFPKPEEWTPEDTAHRPGGLSLTDWEAVAADQAMTIAMMMCEQEPVGEVLNERGEVDYISYVPPIGAALYTSPPKRQPLTDKQIEAVYENASGQELRPQDYRIVLQFARAIEAKLKEKNAC